MIITINPADVTIKPEQEEAGLNVLAIWRDQVEAGRVICRWHDTGKTRLMIRDLEVHNGKQVERSRIFRRERRANFRRLRIGTRLLHEVVRQAPLMGARELFGTVVEGDLECCPFLLKWYAREGFEICDPMIGALYPPLQVARILMPFG